MRPEPGEGPPGPSFVSATTARELVLGWGAFAILCAALVAAPLAFGSVTTWAWATLLVGMVVAGIAASFAGGADPASAPLLRWSLPVAAVVALQLVPLPAAVIHVIAPTNHEVLVGAVPGYAAGEVWQPVSLDRTGTLEAALKATLYVLAFAVAARTAGTARRARWLLTALLVIACFEAFYGLIEQFSGTGRIFAWAKPDTVVKSRASGTYVNPNHFAALLAMGIPAALAFAATGLSGPGVVPRDRLRAALAMTTHPDFPKRVLMIFAVVVLAAGLTGSLSKGGLASALVGIGAVGLIIVRSSKLAALLAPVAIAAIVLGGGAAGLSRALERFRGVVEGGSAEPSVAARLSYAIDTLDLAWRSPLVGVGAGAFEAVFPRFQPAGIGVTHAHNDYAQVLAELGFVAGAALLIGLVLTGWGVLRGDDDRERRPLALTCLAALAPIAVHSLVDFNLRIPANALWASALLGAAWGLSRRPVTAPVTARRRALSAVTSIFALVAAGVALPLAWADWEARPEIERAKPDERPLPMRIAALERALSVWPYEARHWGELASTRWYAARSSELDAAREAAAALAGPLTEEATLRQLELMIFSTALRTSEALRTAADQSLGEARRAQTLAPGEPRWGATVAQIEQERPGGP